jgi:hypothetical protein
MAADSIVIRLFLLSAKFNPATWELRLPPAKIAVTGSRIIFRKLRFCRRLHYFLISVVNVWRNISGKRN